MPSDETSRDAGSDAALLATLRIEALERAPRALR